MATNSVATGSASAKPKAKRRKVLTIDEKISIIKELETSTGRVVADRYGVATSMISDIKKIREKILRFKHDMSDMGMSRKAKVMKLGHDAQHDKAVYVWFKQKRMEGMPISGPILSEKAIVLHKIMYGEESNFCGSTGWQWRFCKRHGIRNLALQGEICTWLNSDSNDPGLQLMTDEEICEHVHVLTDTIEPDEDDRSEGPEQNICPVSNSEAAHMFEKCLIWLEHQPEANLYNTCMLKELHSMAVRKRIKLLKQKTIPEMLHVPTD